MFKLLSFFYIYYVNHYDDTMFYLCVYFCVHVAVSPADANCKTEWAQLHKQASYRAQYHKRASNVSECQKACEFDFRCVAIDWRQDYGRCWINRIPNHTYRTDNHFGKQYTLPWGVEINGDVKRLREAYHNIKIDLHGWLLNALKIPEKRAQFCRLIRASNCQRYFSFTP